MSALCRICGGALCNHTPEERSQWGWQIHRPLTEEEARAFDRDSSMSNRIFVAKRAHKQAVFAQEVQEIYGLSQAQLDVFFLTWTNGPNRWPQQMLWLVEECPGSLHSNPKETSVKDLVIKLLVQYVKEDFKS